MWQYDFHLFYMGARAVLEGASPYQMWDFNGPYPLAVFFIPLAWLPEPVAYFIFLAANIILAWKLLGLRKSLWPLISFPVIFCLFVGQIDFLLTMLIVAGSPWTLGLAIIKPQLGFVFLPWLIKRFNPKDYLKASIPAIILTAISFILRPGWVHEWLAGSPGMQNYSEHASNIYWIVPLNWRTAATLLGALIAFPVSFLFKERVNSWSFLSLFAPLTNIYSPSVLAQWIGPLEVGLSWLAIFLVRGKIHYGAPLFIIVLAILIKEALKNHGFSSSFKKKEEIQ
jgi:Glycosyltransferase family 87